MKLFTVYAILIVIASCSMPTESDLGEVGIVSNIKVKETQKMEIKPIAEYQGYAVLGKQVYGLGESGKTLIKPEDTEGNPVQFEDFFTKNTMILFTVKTMESGDPIPDTAPVQYEAVEVIHCFTQDEGIVQPWTGGGFPSKPESVRQEMGIAPWSIVTTTAGEVTYSSLVDVLKYAEGEEPQITTGKNHLTIDGYCVIGEVIWYSVLNDGQEKEPGLFSSVHGSKRFPLTKGDWRVFKL